MQNNFIEEKLECHIHDNSENKTKAEIRTHVCLSEDFHPFKQHKDGNYYCLFHLPSLEKDVEAFEKFFRQKLSNVEKVIKVINNLPEEKNREVEIGYNFHYLWFPSRVDLFNYKFEAVAIFDFAYFSKGAKFSSATFSKGADFREVTVKQLADFRGAVFIKKSNFSGAIFDGFTNFGGAVFIEDVLFELAQFTEEVNFRSVTFRKGAYFHRIKTTENSKLSFIVNPSCQLLIFAL